MRSAVAPMSPVRRSWFVRIAYSILCGLWFLFRLLLVLWATLVIYYSNLPWFWGRAALALAFFGFSIWALWFARRRGVGWVFVALFLGVCGWYVSIQPSHDRIWRGDVAVMPRAIIDGDKVTLTGFRNFEYRSRDDFTPRFEERVVSFSHLTSVDLEISYWMPGPVAHTFVSFNFDNALPVCISIETRPEVGEGFATIASMFKQFELIYVVGDERDLIRSRTNYRDETVFLYPIRMPPERARELFRVYLERINELADHPEFYHLLKNSCTINIVRYANRAGREGPLDIRQIINGWVDRYLYRAGHVDTSLPFDELRRRSDITPVSKAAENDETYSKRIRENLPPAPEGASSSRVP
jgi:hypothetical protein